jgi:hypothetical protein
MIMANCFAPHRQHRSCGHLPIATHDYPETISRSQFFSIISAGLFPTGSSQLCKIPEADPMLDCRRRDLHQDTRGAAAQVLVAPSMLAEGAQRLGDGFVKGLRG